MKKEIEKEFNLSEKINQYGYNDDGTPDSDILEVKDVKEFIRLLKEEIVPMNLLQNKEQIRVLEIIDKLAGDKLNGK